MHCGGPYHEAREYGVSHDGQDHDGAGAGSVVAIGGHYLRVGSL